MHYTVTRFADHTYQGITTYPSEKMARMAARGQGRSKTTAMRALRIWWRTTQRAVPKAGAKPPWWHLTRNDLGASAPPPTRRMVHA